MAVTTIRSLKAAYPDLFCPQDWYEGEAFYDYDLSLVPEPWRYLRPPLRSTQPHRMSEAELVSQAMLVPAVVLVAAFVKSWTLNIWRDYLWTSDCDAQGQRVYVGGTANGRGFEIHRHLHLTERWGVPVW